MNDQQINSMFQEVLEAINEASTKTQEQFTKQLTVQLSDLKKEMNERFDDVYKRLDYHETWLNRIEKNMATKVQLNSLVNILNKKDIISKFDVHQVTSPDYV